MQPIYTVDWFSANIPLWSNCLGEFKGRPVRGLEIGSFQGRSARWLFENILTHPDARLTCVDTFEGSEEHYAVPGLLTNLRGLFDHNLKPYEEKLTVLVGPSGSMLRTHSESYDFAYVDGDHHAPAVLDDAINAFRLLKYGGILIFDDYLWTGGGKNPADNPGLAIDAFLAIYSKHLIVLFRDYQVVVRKVSHA